MNNRTEETKNNRWIIYDGKDIGCTNCRCPFCGEEFFFPLIRKHPYNFCPKCGAEMTTKEVQA